MAALDDALADPSLFGADPLDPQYGKNQPFMGISPEDPSQNPAPVPAPTSPLPTPQNPSPTQPPTPTNNEPVSPDNPAPTPGTTNPAPTPPAAGTPPRYNTTPDWQDPYSAPTVGDPYWDAWHAANPTYTPPAGQNPWPIPTAANGQPKLSVQDFLSQWRRGHIASSGVQPLLDAFKAGGYSNVTPYMYGNKQSNNEISVDGQKFKVISGEDSPNPTWYLGGPDNGPITTLPGGVSTGGSGTGGTDQLSSLLMSLLNQGQGIANSLSAPVTADDPIISAMMDAYHGKTQRSLALNREQMAERAHAEGVPSGAFDAALGNAENEAGINEAGLSAQLMEQEQQNRRGALGSIFGSTLGGTNTGLGLAQQNQQFYDNLAEIMSSHGNDLDSILASLALHG